MQTAVMTAIAAVAVDALSIGLIINLFILCRIVGSPIIALEMIVVLLCT